MSAHTEIIADTDRYSGNFEREITAWVFGVLDDSDVGGEYQVRDEALAWAREADEKPYTPGALEMVHSDDGEWSTWQNIASTPGWTNDGMGHFSRLDDKTTGDAPLSVVWRFNRILSDAEISTVRERVLSFAVEGNKKMQDSQRDDAVLTVEGVRALDAEETRTEQWRTDVETVARSPQTEEIVVDDGEYVPKASFDEMERNRDFWRGTDLPGRRNFNEECEHRPGVSVGEDLVDKSVTNAMKADTAERKLGVAEDRITEIETKLAVAKTDFERITYIGGMPRDSLLSKVRQYEERGQAIMDVANDALDRLAEEKPKRNS